MLGISRRTLCYWVRDYNWEHIKKSAQHIPLQLAENCYFIMKKMQEDILSEERREKAPTYQEVNALYKLTLTVNKLKSRNTLNETLELGAHFMEFVNNQNPAAADLIKPYIDSYIVSRATDQSKQFTPINTPTQAPANQTDHNDIEAQLDLEDMLYWAQHPHATTDSVEAERVSPTPLPHAENKTTATNISINAPLLQPSPRPSITLPKNEKLLNRAQRRQLARSKAAA